MENKYITTGLATAIIILLMFSFTMSANVASLNVDIDQYKEDKAECATSIAGYKTDIEKNMEEIAGLKWELDNYECPECPECPEPDTVYITEYVYDYIYLDNAIFDVTRNGIVDHEDVCAVWAYINNGMLPMENVFYTTYDNAWELLYDVNADGCVDEVDVELILEHSDI